MAEITAPTNFARIIKCGDCAEREVSNSSRPNYSLNPNYSGASMSSYNNSNARYS
jgi:hypothetical protein